jgi:hypothetical protein
LPVKSRFAFIDWITPSAIGCDFHSRFQQIAMLDPTTGEVIERRLEHENGEDFLTLWKDADPDIPILKQAKAECAKLQ